MFPFKHAEQYQGRHAQHAGNGIINAVKTFGQPETEGRPDDDQGFDLNRRPWPGGLVKSGQLVFGIGPENQIDNTDRRRDGEQGGRHGIENPLKKSDFQSGVFF